MDTNVDQHTTVIQQSLAAIQATAAAQAADLSKKQSFMAAVEAALNALNSH